VPAWLISLPLSIYQPQKFHWFIFYALKSWIAVGTMLLLISSTSFPRLLKSLRDLRAPQLLLSLLSFTYRYLFLLVEEAERLELAFKARTFSKKNNVKRKALSGILGTLFIRSLERSDMVYQAMLARGYNGNFPLPHPSKLKATDYCITIIVALLILGIRIFA
jgi:cobalt/nickel transport system permease protein